MSIGTIWNSARTLLLALQKPWYLSATGSSLSPPLGTGSGFHEGNCLRSFRSASARRRRGKAEIRTPAKSLRSSSVYSSGCFLSNVLSSGSLRSLSMALSHSFTRAVTTSRSYLRNRSEIGSKQCLTSDSSSPTARRISGSRSKYCSRSRSSTVRAALAKDQFQLAPD